MCRNLRFTCRSQSEGVRCVDADNCASPVGGNKSYIKLCALPLGGKKGKECASPVGGNK